LGPDCEKALKAPLERPLKGNTVIKGWGASVMLTMLRYMFGVLILVVALTPVALTIIDKTGL
jgi:hypothetical protein